MSRTHDVLRGLPSVDRLLGHEKARALVARYRRDYVVQQCRAILDELRVALRREPSADTGPLDEATLLGRLEARLEAGRESSLTRVVNATGTVLHTNLGRALLAEPAIDALCRAAARPVNLEYDLDRGARGRRETTIESLLCDLTGAEAATVVNNNAAAVLLALNTVADGREVVASRGELVEIGGAFRIPEIMAKSGAILREVGTTNRTHADDYARAITDRTALLLKVHTSNYRVVGFTAEVGLAELAAMGARHGVPVMEDLGSGALVDLSRYGLPTEPLVAERVALGADLVTFSGDKVLGGPQAGLIVGRERWVREVARNPLHRALRCGKLTVAALEATLRLYQQSAGLEDAIPTLRAFARPLAEIEALGRRVLPALQAALGADFTLSLEDSTAQVGSGALPTGELPSKVVAVERPGMSADRIAARFRAARPPIIGRIHDDRFLLDLRTIGDPEEVVPVWHGGA
jgi:L-seryl-tRNA(Ser) seleniumtransferase